MNGSAPRILLAGATGLVGALALEALLAAGPAGLRILAPTRRALATQDPRLREAGLASGADGLAKIAAASRDFAGGIDCYACALGTTLRAAGSREAFRAVDLELVIELGRIARSAGARQAVVVSSVGANPGSANFYLKVKGQAEEALAALGFEQLDLLQPGLLLGERSGRERPGERLAQTLAPLYNPLLLGPLRRYQAVPAASVARALARLVGTHRPGVHRYENPAIVALARG